MAQLRIFWGRKVAAGGGSTYNVSLLEAGAATDSASAAAVFASAVAEAVSATDTPASLLVAVATLTDAASATDTVAAGSATYEVAVTEAASAADAASAIATLVGAVSESLSAAETFSAIGVFGRSVSEAASAADATNWGSATYNVDLTEAASLADAVAAALQALGTMAEAASATDTPSVLIVAGASVLEPATAAEVVAGTKQMLALLTEASAATDSVQGVTGQIYAASIAEALAAGDLVAATLVPAGTFERVPAILVLQGKPRDRTVSLAKPARSIGALLREQ